MSIRRFGSSLLTLAACSAALNLGAGEVLAQDEAQSGVQVMSLSVESDGVAGGLGEGIAAALADGAANFSFSSSGPIGMMGGMGVDPGNKSQLMELLNNKSVREELKLTDAQFDGVKQVQRASQKRMSELFRERLSNRSGGTINLTGIDFKAVMEENQADAESAIEEILLPSQLKRVRQLAYQVDVHQIGLGKALISGRLGKDVDVHEDQKQHLLDRAAKIEEEAMAEIKRIRAAAQKKLLAELAPEQRKKAEELLGDFFLYQEKTMAQRMREAMSRAGASRQLEGKK